MRIAIVTESFPPRANGVTDVVCRVREQLTRRGHEVLVVAPGPDDRSWFTPGLQIPFHRAFAHGLPSGQVTAMLRDFRPDVVHLAAPLPLGAFGLAAARRLDLPVVAVFQADPARFRHGTGSLRWAWLRHLHERADRTLVSSRPALNELRRRGFPRLALWARGVDVQRFHPRRRSAGLRARLAPGDTVLAGYVGRLPARGRPGPLSHLTGLPGVRLVVALDGPAPRRLERLLPDAIFTVARTGPELSELVASLDVFLHTGAEEAIGPGVPEALAAGVPVVAPASGGPLDLVRPGHSGLLYPPGDPSALRAAVAALAADPALRTRMGGHARLSVHGRDWSAVCDELLGHYDAVRYGTVAERAA